MSINNLELIKPLLNFEQEGDFYMLYIFKRKKDQPDIKIGSGGSNRNKIRYPKKCRKTAWKRFYKLFPHLKKENFE